MVQEAFVKAYRALDTFRNERRVPAVAAADRRQRDPQPAPLAGGAAPHWSCGSRYARTSRRHPRTPEQSAVAADTNAILLAAVNAMPHRDRLVLTCRYFLDLSETETAQVLAWPRGSVKSRLSRALDKLRRALPAELAEEVARDR